MTWLTSELMRAAACSKSCWRAASLLRAPRDAVGAAAATPDAPSPDAWLPCCSAREVITELALPSSHAVNLRAASFSLIVQRT